MCSSSAVGGINLHRAVFTDLDRNQSFFYKVCVFFSVRALLIVSGLVYVCVCCVWKQGSAQSASFTVSASGSVARVFNSRVVSLHTVLFMPPTPTKQPSSLC